MTGRLSELATILGATLHGADRDYRGASIDTRVLQPGALFFALPGSRVDGHEFVGRAASLGAAAVVVERVIDSRIAQLQVPDVQAALQRAGAYARGRFQGQVIGVTGSNGKTTVKQMLAAICGRASTVMATEGNLNNHLGVPLTLMRLDDDVQYAVVEMGANHAGEIDMLCGLARPDIGLVTNAGWAHLEGFGSRDGVAHAKGEMFAGLGSGGVAVLNADDDYAGLWTRLIGERRCLRFALQAGQGIDVYATDIDAGADISRFVVHTPDGEGRVTLPLAGAHNISNALAAAAAASALSIDVATIARGLSDITAVGGRMAIAAGRNGARIVDDSYNANPGSLAVALDWLAMQPAPRWAALGDMGELGDYTAQAHRDAGTALRAAGVVRLWAIGEHCRLTVEAFGDGGQWFADQGALNDALGVALDQADANVTLLIKGSRGARMDRVVDAMRCADNAWAGAPC